MGLFDGLFGGNNAAHEANKYLNKIPGMEEKYYNPFINRGNDAYNVYSPIINSMTSDPSKFLESLLQNYEPSRAFNLKKDNALKAAGNTAAAGGMRGSLQDIDQEARLTDMLLGEDMQQWLQNVLGIQGAGLETNQNLYNTGFNASSNLASDLANVYGTQAQLGFYGARDNNKSLSDLFSGLSKLGFAGLGYSQGGIPGAYIGTNIGNQLF